MQNCESIYGTNLEFYGANPVSYGANQKLILCFDLHQFAMRPERVKGHILFRSSCCNIKLVIASGHVKYLCINESQSHCSGHICQNQITTEIRGDVKILLLHLVTFCRG